MFRRNKDKGKDKQKQEVKEKSSSKKSKKDKKNKAEDTTKTCKWTTEVPSTQTPPLQLETWGSFEKTDQRGKSSPTLCSAQVELAQGPKLLESRVDESDISAGMSIAQTPGALLPDPLNSSLSNVHDSSRLSPESPVRSKGKEEHDSTQAVVSDEQARLSNAARKSKDVNSKENFKQLHHSRRLEERVQTLTDEVSKKTHELQTLDDKMVATHELLQQCQQEKVSLASNLEQRESQIEVLKNQLSQSKIEHQNALKDSQVSKKSLESQVAGLQAKLGESHLEIDCGKKELQTKTEVLQKKVDELEKKVKNSNANHNLEIIKAQEDIGELRLQNEQLKEEMTKQENINSELREEHVKNMKDLKSQNDELSQKCQAYLEQDRVDHEDFAAQVALDTPTAEANHHLHEEIEQYKQQISQLQSEIAISKAAVVADFDKQLTELQEDIDKENAEKALEKKKLSEQIQAREDEIRILKSDKQTLQQSEFSVMKQLHSKEQEAEQAIAKVATLADQCQLAKEENTKLQTRMKEMEKGFQERSNQCKLLEGELTHLKEKTDEKQALSNSNESLENSEDDFEDAPESPLEMSSDENRTDSEKLKLQRELEVATELSQLYKEKVDQLQEELKHAKEEIEDQNRIKQDLTCAIKLAKIDNKERISEGTDVDSKLKQMKDRYLDLTDRMIDQEDRYKRKVEELLEKLEDRDDTLKQLRTGDAPFMEGAAVATANDHSKDCLQSEQHITQLKEEVQIKESQYQKVHNHSKQQSKKILELKDELQALKSQKEDCETELSVLRGELEGNCSDKSSQKGRFSDRLRHAECEDKIEKLEAEVSEWKSFYDKQEKQSAKHPATNVRRHSDSVMPKMNPEVYSEYLEGQVAVLQEEVVELKKTATSLNKELANVKVERNHLQEQHLILISSNRDLKNKLTKLLDEVSAQRSTVESLNSQIVSKTNLADELREKNKSLQKQNSDLEAELQVRKVESEQFQKDFEIERMDRSQLAGRYDEEKAKASIKIQQIREEQLKLERALECEQIKTTTLEVEKANLEVNLAEEEKKVKAFEILMETTLEKLQQEQSKSKQKAKESEDNFTKIQVEFEEKAERLKAEADQIKAQLDESASLATAEKMSLEEQLAQVASQYKLKEKQLEITASEKQNLEEQLERSKARFRSLQDQCDGSKQQLDASIADTARLHDEVLAKTAQVKQYKKQTDSYKIKVEEAQNEIAQCKKQIDSYTVKLEEAQNDIAQTQQSWKSLEDQYKTRLRDLNSKLQHKHLELRQCQEQLKTMEDDKEYEIQKANASFEANKLLGETELVKAQREIASLKVELRQWKTKLVDEGQVSEMLSIEIEKGKKLEEQLVAAQAKYSELMDRCNARYEAIETLQQTLKDNGVSIPRINIGLQEVVRDDQQQGARQYGQAAFSPTLLDQESLGQRQLAPKQQHQMNQLQNSPQRHYTAPQSLAQHVHSDELPSKRVLPRVQEDGYPCGEHDQQGWEGQYQYGQQMPPTIRAQTQQPAGSSGHRIDTGPPLRAKDPRLQQPDYAQHHQGGPQLDYTNREEYYRADQHENQQWANQGGYSPSPHRPPHIPQYPPSDQQGYPPNPTPTTQGYTPSGGPGYNQGHVQQQYPPSSPAPGYQQQPQQYQQRPEYAQGNYPQHQGSAADQRQMQVNQQGRDFNQAANTPQAAAFGTQLPLPSPQPLHPTQRDQSQGGPAPQQPTPLPRKISSNSTPGQGSSPSAARKKQNSEVQENVLLEGIDRDIKEAAELVTQEGEVMESMAPEAPFDPNLICPLCMRNFRVGEIQKYKKHVNTCQGQL